MKCLVLVVAVLVSAACWSGLCGLYILAIAVAIGGLVGRGLPRC